MKSENIILQINEVFKGRTIKPTDCITTEKGKLFYIDDNKVIGKCIVLKGFTYSPIEEQKYFKIINENEKIVSVWAVDGCFLSSGQKERCDCIFFDDNDFCFVEFKFNATSLHPDSVKYNRKKAISQLKSTFEMIQTKFSEFSYTFMGFNLEAYVCTPDNYPHKNTAISDYAVEFLEEYGIKLYEKNEKICD